MYMCFIDNFNMSYISLTHCSLYLYIYDYFIVYISYDLCVSKYTKSLVYIFWEEDKKKGCGWKMTLFTSTCKKDAFTEM